MRLLEVGTHQQRISRLEYVPHLGEELHSGRSIEVADRTTQKKNAEVLARLAIRSHLQQAIEIFALESDNTDRVDIAQLALAHHQRRVRDFHGIVGNALLAAERLQQPASLASAAAAEFSNRDRTLNAVHNFVCVPAQ